MKRHELNNAVKNEQKNIVNQKKIVTFVSSWGRKRAMQGCNSSGSSDAHIQAYRDHCGVGSDKELVNTISSFYLSPIKST